MKSGEIIIGVPFSIDEVKDIENISADEEMAKSRFVRKLFMKSFCEFRKNKKLYENNNTH